MTVKLKHSVSAMALLVSVGVAMAGAASAQTETKADEPQEVVVVGARKALQSAQQIKKNADTVVDSITANDIGAFPDKSVAEALQRVAGITVNRFAATGDTAHFSAEPSGVVVRGLQQVRSEFNGRDIFTADSNRGLSWSDVSPELMGGVDVYKNQTAELIEGGIAGTVNLRTRLPFDQKGRVLAATAEYTYGDLVGKGAASVSGIYADRWDTELGEFGVMINAAHSEVYTNSEGVQLGRMALHSNAATWGTTAMRYYPTNISLRDNIYNRVRDGLAFAAQWKSNDGNVTATFQYNQSKKQEKWEEYVSTAYSGTDMWAKDIEYYSESASEAQCKTGTTCTFDSNGFLQKGTLLASSDVWYGQTPANPKASSSGTLPCYSWEACGGSQRGTGYATSTRFSDSVNDTKDASFNLKWQVSDKLFTSFDVQYVDAIQTNYDISGTLSTFADVTWDLTGDLPKFTLANATGFQLATGGVANPENYRLNDLMDHVTDSDGNEFAVRADANYSFDSPWLNMIKFGVRHAEREQTVRWSIYNWANVVNTWTTYGSWNDYFITGSAFPDKTAYGTRTFDEDFYGGGLTNANTAVYLNIDLLKDREKLANTFNATVYPAGGTNVWQPVCKRTGIDSRCFRPSEIAEVSEVTDAAYIQLKFGGDDALLFGKAVTGNIGVRYVETTNESTGGINFGNQIAYDADPTSPVLGPNGDPLLNPDGSPVTSINYSYYVSAADRAFMTQNNTRTTASITHKNWLPSFNARMTLDDTWYVRIAASRAMSRPDIGNLKSYTSVNAALPNIADRVCGKGLVCNSSGQIQSVVMTYTGDAQNPYLKPVTADQFDLSFENYFSSTGSFTFSLFYKQFHDYITYGRYIRDFTNQGVTRSVEMRGPVNGDGGAIKGWELSYKRFFDGLPSPWNGLGVDFNYTMLNNTGIKSTNVVVNSGDGTSGQTGGGTSVAAKSFTDLPLEGLSDKTFNLVGMYEKGAWSARLAYNWRSEFLVTSQDCCIALPIWQESAGYLDARLAYRFNDNIEVSVEGTNLLDTETVLLQQVDGPTNAHPNDTRLLLPNAWFKNDRRVQAQVRLKF
ncbi:TonB-dependent receptor [Asticcacaulis sp. AND118]|uniref:TonB-dependent receptor n=1 Tax=Asticcacaulis sp. AND118 TaxID=2840468 RepID=UPI001CFFE093|nr:TonB-dependent receptor [Asticcacaulis sp. AND118]UDF05511.1 TonB-dependent receptor [Asticcacaulis sp. AND118]